MVNPPFRALSVLFRTPLCALSESHPVTSPQLYRVAAEMSRDFFLPFPCRRFITSSCMSAVHGMRNLKNVTLNGSMTSAAKILVNQFLRGPGLRSAVHSAATSAP
jgi:hypothetical protein